MCFAFNNFKCMLINSSSSTKLNADNAGKVVYTFGNAALVKDTSWSTIKRQKIQIKLNSKEMLSNNDQYMFDPLVDKCFISGDRLFALGKEIYLKQYEEEAAKPAIASTDETAEEKLEIYEDLHFPDLPSQEKITCVGRIYADNESKIDLSSTVLVGMDEAALRTTQLNFYRMKSLALFPGQTIVVKGINPRGDTIYAEEIFSERNLDFADVPQITDPLNMVVATGPYTFNDDLCYEPLHELMSYCKQHKPDVLILVGPFLCADHSLIADGVLAETFDSFFEKMIVGIVEVVGVDCQVLVVSSAQDAHSAAVYPTYPYGITRTFSNLTFLPDPCIVNINGVSIGLTATDIVSHLNETELAM